ncbi:MAG: Gfo/Idh/MocA family oxidoreductase, partial [bacterium]
GVRTFVFLSSSSAKGDAPTAYGRSKIEAERALFALKGIDVIVIRPNLVVGPGGRGLFARMRALVERLPVLPVPGTGSPVQPIHVDDLAEGVFRAIEGAPRFKRRVFDLGSREAVSLGDLLRRAADAAGKRPLIVPLPVRPVELAARAAEALGLPFPFGSGNLAGLRTAAALPTQESLEALGLALRPLVEALRDRGDPVATPPLDRRPVRLLVVGTGRMGLLHAVTAARMRGVVVTGLVDVRRSAARAVRRLGVAAPVFGSLEEALSRAPAPDAAIVATASASHLPHACTLLEGGLAVLVEKPLATAPAGAEAFAALRARYPGKLLDGYVLPRVPAVAEWIAALHSGRLGAVRSFAALSLIDMRGARGWQTDPGRSGGGALMAVGTHSLSLLAAALGVPELADAERIRRAGSAVEDSMVLRLRCGNAQGVLATSWAALGYARPGHLVALRTDRGRLMLGTAGGIFVGDDSGIQDGQQEGAESGFVLAPEAAGGGYRRELEALCARVRGDLAAGAQRFDPLELEHLIFRAYAAARDVSSFTPLDAATEDAFAPAPASAGATAEAEGVSLTIPDLGPLVAALRTSGSVGVLQTLGWRGAAAALRHGIPAAARERGATYWAAMEALTAAALSAVPRGFTGTLLLDSFLTDLALALDRPDVIARLAALCRRRTPRARVGARTANPDELANAVALGGARFDPSCILGVRTPAPAEVLTGGWREAFPGLLAGAG